MYDLTGKLTGNFQKTVKYLTVFETGYDFRLSFMVKSNRNSDLTEFHSKVSSTGILGRCLTLSLANIQILIMQYAEQDVEGV